MAVDATELFLRTAGEHRLEPADVSAMASGVEFVHTVEDSKLLTARRGPMIVLSASGMLTGGRVLHHLFQVAPDHRSTIVLVGFQAAGTRGESLLNGATSLRVFGQDIPVRARVVHLDSLSAHADADGLLDWLRAAPAPPNCVSIVHGEPAAADALRRRVHLELGWDCQVPALMSTTTVASAGVPASVPAGQPAGGRQ
jgi:metallo-beta-lactamase family protein